MLNRRSLLKSSLSAGAAAHASAQGRSARPNILWICTDQQRWDTIQALGNDRIRTPNIDRLVREGVAFTRTYCQNPVCTPSRGSFLTGCYPSTIRCTRNGNDFFPGENTPKLISRILDAAGYDCGLVGKFHLSSSYKRVEPRLDDGYRRFEWSHAPRWEDHWPIEQQRYHFWLRERGGDFRRDYRSQTLAGYPAKATGRPGPGMETRLHEVTWCAETAIDYMKGALDKPWFISVNTYAPHPPFDPPKEFLERMDPEAMARPLFQESDMETQRRFHRIDHQTKQPHHPDSYDYRRMIAAYYAQTELVDFQVGRMLEALQSTGQLDDTIVIFTSDHGEMLGDHALNLKGCRFYEGAVRVPLIFRWPARFRRGLRSPGLTELTDITPTLLEAVGLPIPDHVQGRSLMPILEGARSAAKHREFVRSECFDSLEEPNSTRAIMLRDERYKLVFYQGHEIGELYDLEEDPHEFRNLWESRDHSATKGRLISLLVDDVIRTHDLGAPRIGPM